MRKDVFLVAAVFILLLAGAVRAGKSFTLVSGHTGPAETIGTAQSVDGHYKDWTFQAICSGNPNVNALQPQIMIEGSIDNTTWNTVAVLQWTTSISAGGKAMFRPSSSIPVRKIRGRWGTIISWTTAGNCSLYGLGVN